MNKNPQNQNQKQLISGDSLKNFYEFSQVFKVVKLDSQQKTKWKPLEATVTTTTGIKTH